MSAGRWAAALDEFAACLAEQERQLAQRRPDLVVEFVPPAELGPLPVELGERARALLQQSDRLAAQVDEAMRATRRQLALTRRMATESGAVPAYVDSHA